MLVNSHALLQMNNGWERKREMVSIHSNRKRREDDVETLQRGIYLLIRSKVLKVFLDSMSSTSSFQSISWSDKTSLSTQDVSREPSCDEPLG